MLKFIQQLKTLHIKNLEALPEDSEELPAMTNKLSTLRLAEASLRKLQLNQQSASYPLQLSILGPTQSGKSTLINFLTDTESAGTSALAGFTVHAHAFAIGESADDTLWADLLFEGFEKVSMEALDVENYQQYTVQHCESSKLKKIAPCVLWDTPDFDSINSSGYHSAVLCALALSDIIILILSREKYADKSVWNLLDLALPLQKPMLVCINKLDSTSEEAVIKSFKQRYKEIAKDAVEPSVIGLPFIRGLDAGESKLPAQNRKSILNEIKTLAVGVDRKQQKIQTYAFIEKYWKPWTGLVTDELYAMNAWKKMIDASLVDAISQYKRDYLNHPEKYGTFNQTLAQLLMLLEIPGIAEPLVKIRKVITWPARKLFNYGKRYTSSEAKASTANHIDMEQTVLSNICDSILTSLITQINEQDSSESNLGPWWHNLSQQLFDRKTDIGAGFESEVLNYQDEFKADINFAAQDLYQNLENQPATLNGLRAARATADAAAVVFAIKTGGIGVSDLVLAPAMLSVTTMLTESALGSYINRVKAKLRVQQMESVNKKLFSGYLNTTLLGLLQQNPNSADLSISQKSLADAEDALRSNRA